MIQKTYHFSHLTELSELLVQIQNDPNVQTASGVLLQLYDPRLDIDEQDMVQMIRTALPDAALCGITAANIAGDAYDISKEPVELSVTCFFKTKLIQFDYPLDEMTSFVAGRKMNEELENLSDVQCLQVCYNSKSSSIGVFMREFRHHKLPKFGVKAGRSIRAKNDAHVYGRKVYNNGVVVIAFVSTSLFLYMDNNLGWRSIGLDMTITETAGDNIIASIDHQPAVDIYTRYLKVAPGESWVQNVCEFPLILKRNGFQIARVPAAYDDAGHIYFASDVRQGDHFRLSYADKEQLCALTAQSAGELSDFAPEAVFLFECGNRSRFLKQDASTEIGRYRAYAPQLSAVTGYAEIFVTPDGAGGDLNSSLVAVGLKECPSADSADAPTDAPTSCSHRIITCRSVDPSEGHPTDDGDVEVPFIERILTFLETTSAELNAHNKTLGKIAYTDRLTQIYNRWELERKIDEAIEFSDPNEPCGLLFIDIDHFKAVNDTYGHDVGDQVLQAVVNLIKEKLEDGHAFGRFGGEEFIYLLPKATPESLFTFAESIRKSIDEICFITVRHLTISLGATLAIPGDTKDTLIKRADEAVYEAKETGRNKVVMH
ncbi:MAG: GGDEF domain-containing protein [Lachnospiraceae bacterium]|nr:GGDEF domain-containing protein [Lachnospiraceae bacterium]